MRLTDMQPSTSAAAAPSAASNTARSRERPTAVEIELIHSGDTDHPRLPTPIEVVTIDHFRMSVVCSSNICCCAECIVHSSAATLPSTAARIITTL